MKDVSRSPIHGGDNPVEVSVTMSSKQAELFQQLAEATSSEPGNVLLALACARLESSAEPNSAAEIKTYLWDYVGAKCLPCESAGWIASLHS